MSFDALVLHTARGVSPHTGVNSMSKGMNQKKQEKKKPAKSLDEKRAAKKAKKVARGFLQQP